MNHETHSGVAAAINAADRIRVNDDLSLVTEKQRVGFESRIDKSGGPDSCWIWTGDINTCGYGRFRLNGKKVSAHGISYRNFKGEIPCNLCVLHNCPTGDNPSCVNPLHLWLGTHRDNNRDREAKGRGNQPSGDRHGSKTCPGSLPSGDAHWSRLNPEKVHRGDDHYSRLHPEKMARGESGGNSKLKNEQVIEIRRLRGEGLTLARIGEMFGVTKNTVHSIIIRKTWAHLPAQ
jgi:hypothetical protein